MTDIPNEPSVYKFEVVRHTLREPEHKVNSPEDIFEEFRFLEKYDREHILRVDLNNAHEMIGYETVGIGTDNMVNVGPKEVFRGALLSGASCFILVHNHPSGQIEPSREDSQTADKFRSLGDELELKLLDFMIIGRCGRYYSYAENNQVGRASKSRIDTQAAESQHD